MNYLLQIDRRIIFILVLVAVVLGTVFADDLQFPIKTSKPVRGLYEAMDKLEPGAPVLIALDFDPSSAPELEPMARSVLRQCFRKGLHPIGMTHWNAGIVLVSGIMKDTAREFDDVEVEYVELPASRMNDAQSAARACKGAHEKEEMAAIMRVAAFGPGADSAHLIEVLAKSPGGEQRDAALKAVVEAAAKIPADRAPAVRKVNFGRQNKDLLFDTKYKARDLLWHLAAGEAAPEAVPVVDKDRTITAYQVARVKSRATTVTDGADWCFLGYKAGAGVLMISMGQNLYAAFPTDNSNRSTRDLPILKNVGSLRDVKYLFELAAGDTGEQWILYGAERYGFPMGIACTAVMAPDLYPYYGSHQITGLAGGIKGAWEYETLVGVPGRATQAAPVQTVAHLLVIALILFCNVAYFAQRFSRPAN